MKDLFHGTVYDISGIDLTQGKGYKDFGKGFYATAIKNHAENIARRKICLNSIFLEQLLQSRGFLLRKTEGKL